MIPLRDDNPTRRTPVLTLALIALNVAVYFLVQPQGDQGDETTRFSYEYAAIPCEVTSGEPLPAQEVLETVQTGDDRCQDANIGGNPVFPDKSPWLAVVYSMFFHGGLLHLGGNMLFLWIFGNNIEDRFGPVRYLAFYLASGVAATAAHVLLQPDSTIPLVGASGAVAGVMGAYLVWFPNTRILSWVFIFLVPISARWLLGYWFVSQFFVNPSSGVAWAAHVGGFVFGAAIGLLTRRTALGPPRASPQFPRR